MPTDALASLAPETPWIQTLLGLVLLALAATAVNLVVKQVILRLFARLFDGMSLAIEAKDALPIVRRLANAAPAIVISRGVSLVPHLPAEVETVTRNVCTAFIVLVLVLALSAALDLVNDLYQRRPEARSRPIKGYLQVVKILLYGGSLILIAAALMERSPLLLLSGLGAMAAVLMLVFKDTILSLVASVQLSSNDMIRVGDWIEMPQLNADGDVIDIALHTVKVQNWDKTITTIPTHRLISESFKNWRGMFESGGRRIKRALMIDQNSVRFLTDEERERLRRFALIDDYLERKRQELEPARTR
jgi:miniconductance mechanosensitive channel